ncbi:MAG TPA: hypothetical protein VKP30_24390 [Polyangiaceae bacterium]|nr:hypothetical protein [Polyangiaceae bacterium]
MPLTPDQIEALGIKPTPIADDTHDTEVDHADGLPQQHGIGEGNDGFLADTHDDCKGAADQAAAVEHIRGTNSASSACSKPSPVASERSMDATQNGREFRAAVLR